jgi:hypothetical protein
LSRPLNGQPILHPGQRLLQMKVAVARLSLNLPVN